MTTARQPSGTTTAKRPLFERPILERPLRPPPSPRQLARDFGATYAANGLIGLIFAGTGPVAVVLAVGHGRLTAAELASWIFGIFFLNGILTVAACWVYRQPLAFFWTIPGTVLVGPALGHLNWPQIVGAFFVTGLLMLVLGLTGWVRRAMAAIPMPIVMAMVAGVFLRFGTDLVHSLTGDLIVSGPMVLLFLLLSALPSLGRWLPPIIGALVVGVLVVVISGRFKLAGGQTGWVAAPVFQTPQWSLQAMIELVLPLAITVLVVQNGQGVAVLRDAGHEAPVNAATIACGLWSLPAAAVGAVSTCLTGPTNALLAASGQRSRHYTAGMFCGLLAILFGLFAPLFTRLMLATPTAFIATLGGLAMLRVLQSSFVTAFSSRFTLGSLITFVVTVSNIAIVKIGAAFWGLVAGLIVSWLLERPDFAARDGD